MRPIKYYLCRLLTWSCRGSGTLDVYEKLCILNQELAKEMQKRLQAERELAMCNRLLLTHNAKLRDLLENQVWINDTSMMLGEMTTMVNDMRGILDVAAAYYEKTPGESL
jgi:hypothetical protein